MLKERLASFKYAIKGIIVLFRSQVNARIHLCATVVVAFAAWYFQVSTIECCILILTIAFVLAAEGFNTALEFLTDLASPNIHPLAGKTKDVAAGAVLIAAIASVIIGVLIFGPRVWMLFFT